MDSYPYAYGQPHGHADMDAHGQPHANPDMDPNLDPDMDTHWDTHGHAYMDPDMDTNSNSDMDPDRNAFLFADAHPHDLRGFEHSRTLPTPIFQVINDNSS
jgi:hypothetical protein